jgi:hypothetical protein
MSEELYLQLTKVWQLMASGRIYAARELLEKLLGHDHKDRA